MFRPEDIRVAQLAGALEMLNAGVTTVVDYGHDLPTPDERRLMTEDAGRDGTGGDLVGPERRHAAPACPQPA